MSVVSLYREIDALGGIGDGDWHEGYSQALDDVLAILTRRGFSEKSDAVDHRLIMAAEDALPWIRSRAGCEPIAERIEKAIAQVSA